MLLTVTHKRIDHLIPTSKPTINIVTCRRCYVNGLVKNHELLVWSDYDVDCVV